MFRNFVMHLITWTLTQNNINAATKSPIARGPDPCGSRVLSFKAEIKKRRMKVEMNSIPKPGKTMHQCKYLIQIYTRI